MWNNLNSKRFIAFTEPCGHANLKVILFDRQTNKNIMTKSTSIRELCNSPVDIVGKIIDEFQIKIKEIES